MRNEFLLQRLCSRILHTLKKMCRLGRLIKDHMTNKFLLSMFCSPMLLTFKASFGVDNLIMVNVGEELLLVEPPMLFACMLFAWKERFHDDYLI